MNITIHCIFYSGLKSVNSDASNRATDRYIISIDLFLPPIKHWRKTNQWFNLLADWPFYFPFIEKWLISFYKNYYIVGCYDIYYINLYYFIYFIKFFL